MKLDTIQIFGPVLTANIRIATCSPNFLILESMGTFDGQSLHLEMAQVPIVP